MRETGFYDSELSPNPPRRAVAKVTLPSKMLTAFLCVVTIPIIGVIASIVLSCNKYGFSATAWSESVIGSLRIVQSMLPIEIGMILLLPILEIYVIWTAMEQRRLVEKGDATEATIIEKKTYVARSTVYSLEYEFLTRSQNRITGSQKVLKDQWDAVQTGEKYWVLFDPAIPELGKLYKFLDYRQE